MDILYRIFDYSIPGVMQAILLLIVSTLVPYFFVLLKRDNPKGIRISKVGKFLKRYLKYKENINIQKFIKYDINDNLYITRDSNKTLSDYLTGPFEGRSSSKLGMLLLGISLIGKTTMFLNELFKNKNLLKNHYLFIPENDHTLLDWNRKLPSWVTRKKIIFFLDDLQLFEGITENSFSKIIDILSKRHFLKLVATCRIKDELDRIKSKDNNLAKFFNEIKLEFITEEQARDLAEKTNKEMTSFDKTPGSIILDIERQKNRISNLRTKNKICYSLLKSCAILYNFLFQRVYHKKDILLIIKNILSSKFSENDYSDCTKSLNDNNLIYFTGAENVSLNIPDSYLDYIKDEDLDGNESSLLENLSYFIKSKEGKKFKRDLSGYFINIGNAYYYKKDFVTAFGKYEKAIEIDPKDATPWFNMGNAYSDKKDFDTAIEKYKKAVKLDPKDADAWNNMGIAYANKKDFDTAIEKFEKAVEIDPKDAKAWFNMGSAYYDKKDFNTAMEKYKKAVEIDPKYALAWFSMGNAYSDKGDYETAIKKYEKVVEIDPKYIDAWSGIGNAYYYKKDFDTAIEKFKKAVEIDPKYAKAWFNMGNAYTNKKDFDTAIEKYEKAVEIDPKYAKAWFNMGIAYSDKGDNDKAIEKYEKAVEIDPKNALAWFNMGIAYYDKKNFDTAIKKYKKAVEIDPNLAYAWYTMGNAYANKKDFDTAIEKYEKAVEIDHNLIEAWYNIGRAYREAGKYSDAKVAYKKFLEVIKGYESEYSSEFITHVKNFLDNN